MDDAERMRLGDGLAGLKESRQSVAEGHRPVAPYHLPEVGAGQVLHDDVRRAGVERPHVEHLRDVLARERNRGARFAEEAPDRVRVLHPFFAKELDRHALAELEVSRSDDDAHPPDPRTCSI